MTVDNPEIFADKYRVKSARLSTWDYSSVGSYFITICTYNKNKFLGIIEDGKMILSSSGVISQNCIDQIPIHNKNVFLATSVIILNHIHMLLKIPILLSKSVETRHGTSLQKRYDNYYFHRIAKRSTQTVLTIINQFKGSVKRETNRNHLFFSWQSRFHDEIIKNENHYNRVIKYNNSNIKNWDKDEMFT